MSTSGYIKFVADGQTKESYNHSDSMPHGIGINVLHWIRLASRDPAALREAITSLQIVGAGAPDPTEADLARLDMYADPHVGDPGTSWHALLRYTQGDPAAILDCGYTVEDGEPGEWIYEINCDDQTFSAETYDGDRVTWLWSALPADRDFYAIGRRLDPNSF
jgi:hypothetical protein